MSEQVETPVIHKIKLSNGQILIVKEDVESIHICTEEFGEIGYYICQIDRDGVTVMTNSGDASEFLVSGLS